MLSGKLLILDLAEGIQYDRKEIGRLLASAPKGTIKHSILLLRTKFMQKVLGVTDQGGVPNYKKLAAIQQGRPGLTPDGAAALHDLEPNAIMIDNISFEPLGANGFHATQRLASPIGDKFTPLVYRVGHTEDDDFTTKYNGNSVRIELGNPPEGLTGYPVGVYVEKK